jgi:beta-phosphoglucomutase-like phosphatase (HAD superfamily)
MKAIFRDEYGSPDVLQLRDIDKPAPETYEEAARMLGTPPERAVVIEDAISGVKAGRTGGFGLVIGVARGEDPEVLRQNGADIVVRDLADLSLV